MQMRYFCHMQQAQKFLPIGGLIILALVAINSGFSFFNIFHIIMGCVIGAITYKCLHKLTGERDTNGSKKCG